MFNEKIIDPGVQLSRLEDWLPYEPPGRIRWRPSHLAAEVEKLWDAQSFMTWRHGAYFNTHIIIMARPLGMIDHREFAGLVAKFNKEMARWLGVSGPHRRGRWCKRARTLQPNPHYWMYVFENSARRGLHLHQLCVVPKPLQSTFAAHVRDWWERAACLDIDPSSIFVGYGSADGGKGLVRHSILVRYLLKSAHDKCGLRNKKTGEIKVWKEILHLDAYPETPCVYVPQMSGVCRALSASAQQVPIECDGEEVRFRSKLWDGEFHRLFDGSEYADYIERQRRPPRPNDGYIPLQSLLL